MDYQTGLSNKNKYLVTGDWSQSHESTDTEELQQRKRLGTVSKYTTGGGGGGLGGGV